MLMKAKALQKGLKAKTRWRTFARKLIPVYFKEMWTYRRRVLTGKDPEDVHKMRVASRRLRALMLDTKKCYPKPAFKVWNRQIETLVKALGGVRDSDVIIQYLAGYRARLMRMEERAQIEALILHCRVRQDRQRQQLRRRLRRWERQSFADDFLQFFSS